MIKNIIAIYPGRFQPFGRHHAESFKWLSSKFGKDKSYIATSDVVNLPKSPLNFKEKKEIISKYGLGSNLVQVKNPYKAEEITQKYDPKTTALVFMVGEKDMKEDPRFKIGKKKDGGDSYFQEYKPGMKMEGYIQHGYMIVAPHTSFKITGFGEMSGTTIRQALSSKSTPEQYKKLFTDIFGWYDPKIAEMLKKKFSQSNSLKESVSFEKSLILEYLVYNLLNEGGAAGHMAHPFDIPTVKTGKDLLSVFQKTGEFLTKNPVPVKIDGVNASIRLAKVDGKTQFVMDRGSNKPLDVKGITTKDLTDRFGEGHGMIRIGGKVLEIFNKALPSIKGELQKLGMLNDPNKMFNIEYVEGKSNVQEYESNFLAIHNILELERVSPTKPNFSSALSKNYTVVLTKGKKETKSLNEWLNKAKNTKGLKLKLKDGKTVDALSKQVFVWIMDGKPVDQLVADMKDAQIAIDSFVIYNATMYLGDVILDSLTSPLGDVKDQEGVVIRDKAVYDKPYKITGSFILRGLQTAFGK